MAKIFFVLGKSCSGKDTIFKKLKEDRELNLNTVTGYTTRPMREGEINGVEYFFVNNEELEALKNQGKVIECRDYNTVYGVWSYFTVDDGQIRLDRDNAILIGTLEVYNQMKRYFGEEQVVPLYIEVEDGLRLERALARERMQDVPNYAELCRRYLADRQDFSEEKIAEAGILKRYENIDFDACCQEIVRDVKIF